MKHKTAFLAATATLASVIGACGAPGAASSAAPTTSADASHVPASAASRAAYGISQWHVLPSRYHVDGLAPDGSARVSIDTATDIDPTGNGTQTQSVTLPDGAVAEAVITYATLPGQTATGGTVTMTRNDFVTNIDAAAVLQNFATDVQDAAGIRPVTADDLVVGGGAPLTCSACAALVKNYNNLISSAWQQCALTGAGTLVTVACGAGAAGASGVATATGVGAAGVPWIVGVGGACVTLVGSGTYDALKNCLTSFQGAGAIDQSQLANCQVSEDQGPCGYD